MPAEISSTFDTSAEGWTVIGDTQSQGWMGSGGDPGGYVAWVDEATGAVSYYQAPSQYLGNKVHYYGGTLSYEILDTGQGYGAYDVELIGGGHTLHYINSGDADFPTPNAWTLNTVSLVASNFIDVATGATASVDELKATLASLSELNIRAEYVYGFETGGLDNVQLTGPAADTTPPVVTAPANITREATSSKGATAAFAATTDDAVDGSGDRITYAEALAGGGTRAVRSGSNFGLGVHTITASASDHAGNTGAASFTIDVVDSTPPVVSAPIDQSLEATSSHGATASFSASAADVVDGAKDPIKYTEILAGGTTRTVHSGSNFSVGLHMLTASATDHAGNTGTANFSIDVVDTAPPVVTAPANQTLTATSSHGASASFAATALDTVDGSGDHIAYTEALVGGGIRTVRSGGNFSVGTHMITASATDHAGNTGTSQFSIEVVAATSADINVGASHLVDAFALPVSATVGGANFEGLVDMALADSRLSHMDASTLNTHAGLLPAYDFQDALLMVGVVEHNGNFLPDVHLV